MFARRTTRQRTERAPRRPHIGVHVRVVGLLVSLAALIGVGTGAVLAMWHDAENVEGRVPLGVVVFGAGAPGAPEYATGTTQQADGGGAGQVTYPFGSAQADELYNGNAP